jgi:osmoprotectant transport system permease protein
VSWALSHIGYTLGLVGPHLYLSLVPVAVGLVISIPLGWLALRSRVLRGFLLSVSGVLYTVPSLALVVVMPLILGTRVLNPINMVATLTVYTVALLIRSVVDALSSVPEDTVAAATAIGYGSFRRFLAVELPLSIPVLVAGLRVATVSNISLVSVGAIIGLSGLGQMFTDGFQRSIVAEIVLGIVATLLLAVLADGALQLIGRLATPWTRVRSAR